MSMSERLKLNLLSPNVEYGTDEIMSFMTQRKDGQWPGKKLNDYYHEVIWQFNAKPMIEEIKENESKTISCIFCDRSWCLTNSDHLVISLSNI